MGILQLIRVIACTESFMTSGKDSCVRLSKSNYFWILNTYLVYKSMLTAIYSREAVKYNTRRGPTTGAKIQGRNKFVYCLSPCILDVS